MIFSFFNHVSYPDVPPRDRRWPVSTAEFDPRNAHERYRIAIETMRFAEECGFDWLAINEHHFSPFGLNPNCNVFGGALVQATSRAKIALLGNLIPLANPVRVAEEYAMLDCMSGGRVIAGLMRGIPHEYLAYNIPPSESWERQREAVALIVKAWTEPEPFGWDGKHYQFKQISIWPKPFQRPHPPVIVSASTDESARFAASIGAGMGLARIADLPSARASVDAYRTAAHEAGWQPTPEHVVAGLHACIADTDEEARAVFAPALAFFTDVFNAPSRDAQRLVVAGTRYNGEADASRWERSHQRRSDVPLDTLIEAGAIVCGSPETVVAQLRRVADTLGAGAFNLVMQIGNIDDRVVRRGLELFRDRVRPAFAGAAVSA
jgi:alkanesulfonate monooxygenase SsuD/methylene tetrahydromethanopterin reductase-like flavin-dependent oxidoreductase (luciferase family)